METKEYERKFLLKPGIELPIKDTGLKTVLSIEAYYQNGYRYRKITDLKTKETEYEKIIKSSTGAGENTELSFATNADEFEMVVKNNSGKHLKKTRYLFDIPGGEHMLDDFNGLLIMEVEFKDKVRMSFYSPHESFKHLIIDEVTTDPRFYSSNLSLKC